MKDTEKFLKLNLLFSLPRPAANRPSEAGEAPATTQSLGDFAASFQKKFPHMRLVNLALAPAAAQNDKHHLCFSADVVALVELNH